MTESYIDPGQFALPGFITSTQPFFYPWPINVGTTNAQAGNIYTIYVSTGGSDTINNTGTVTAPFASISAALTYRYANIDQSIPVVINIEPGIYRESTLSINDNTYLNGGNGVTSNPKTTAGPISIICPNISAEQFSSGDSTIGLANLEISGSFIVNATFYATTCRVVNCLFTNGPTESAFYSPVRVAQNGGVAPIASFTSCQIVTNGQYSAIDVSVAAPGIASFTECQISCTPASGLVSTDSLIHIVGSGSFTNCQITNNIQRV